MSAKRSARPAAGAKIPKQPRSRPPGKLPAQPAAALPPAGSDTGALEASRERLRVISRVTGTIVGTLPLAELAQTMAEEVRSILKMDACIVRLLEGQDLVLLACAGVSPGSLHPRVPLDWGISREIFSLRRPIFIPDVRVHPSIAQLRNRTPGGMEFVSYAGTPLLMGDEIIGIFGLYARTLRDDISAADLDYLRIFGDNIAVVMMNERLYGELKRHRDQLTSEITERRRAEQALRESEERYRRVVEDQTEFIVRWKPDGTLTFVNESYCRYFGKTRAELIGSSFMPLVAEEDREQVWLGVQLLSRGKAPPSGECRMIRQDGETCWLEWSNRALYDEHGQLMELQAVGRDITERKRFQEQLARASKMESIGTLAGGIAHDFGNVLAVILGNASILQREPHLTERVRGLLAEMALAADRGSAFTRQLLAYAQGSTRQLAQLDLNAVIHSVAGLLERLCPRGVELALHLSAELPSVFGDSTQLEQVVLNLGLNAIQASSAPARVEFSTSHATLSSHEAAELEITTGDFIIFRVVDQGQGIGEEIRERIFELFFTTKPMGRGMGLATTLAIVRDHNGQIRVDSTPGEGTTVTVWLPVHAVPTDSF